MEISKILDEIKSRGMFRAVRRQTYAYDLAAAKRVVMAIGRDRTPSFTLDATNTFAYDNLIKWVMGDTTMQALDPETKRPIAGRLEAGIYVAGGTGTGKSWLLEIMSAFCLVDKPIIYIGEEKHPLRWRCYRADAICDDFAATGTIEQYKQAAVLAIQDLGSEPRETLYMGNRLSVIGSLIESRGDRDDQLTLISSNYPLGHQALEDIYGTRVVSRLAAMCNYFEIRGVDRRKAK